MAAPVAVSEAEAKPAEAAPTGEPARAAMVHPSFTDAARIDCWQRVARSASDVSPVLRGIVINCTLLRYEGGKVLLDCPERFRPMAVKHAAKLGEMFSRESGAAVVVEIHDPEAAAATAGGGGAGAEGEAASLVPTVAPARPDPVMVTEHPLVKRALELFQARVVDVQPRKG